MDSLTSGYQTKNTLEDKNKELEKRLNELELQLKEKKQEQDKKVYTSNNSMSLLIDGMNTQNINGMSHLSETGKVD